MTVHTWCADLSCCWGSCTMRNAQVQHAQQRVPCHVCDASRLCCIASWLKFLRSCSLVVALINTKEVRVWPPHG